MNIAIMLAGQQGDIMTAMSILRYRNELWGDSKIVWFAEDRNFDLLKFQPNIEVREFPRGYGYPEMCKVENQKLIDNGQTPKWEDWSVLVDENNHLDRELKNGYPSLKEFFMGFFPAPHQVHIDKRRDITYPNVSKRVFGIPDNWPWHPLLYFSDEEKEMANEFMGKIGEGKTIAIETFAGSGQSKITPIQIIDAMDTCRRILGKCNFIFVSHKFVNGSEQFPEGLINNEDVFSAAHFTARQCALVIGQCDLLISVSSGVTVAASCWGNNPTPIIQFMGSEICGTRALALGEFVAVTTDGKSEKQAQQEFTSELINLLNKIK